MITVGCRPFEKRHLNSSYLEQTSQSPRCHSSIFFHVICFIFLHSRLKASKLIVLDNVIFFSRSCFGQDQPDHRLTWEGDLGLKIGPIFIVHKNL